VKIAVLCADLSDNAAGRAWLLAELARPLGEVRLLGPASGPLWAPLAGGALDGLPVQTVPWRRLPRFAGELGRLAALAEADLVYASKPRLASAGVGYLLRLRRGRPLVLDIDDWELGFALRGGPWGVAGRALNWSNAAGLPWTWLMERARGLADAVTVASRFLQERFGGILLPHVRDTERWFPGCADPGEVRRRLGVGSERLVMFLGTAREYKGVNDLADAVRRLGRPDVALAVVGTDPAGPTARRLRERLPGVRLPGPVALGEVPRYLSAADVVVVPQRDTPDTRGQVPAKLFDAMALGRPIVATAVSMIPEILQEAGLLVPPGEVEALAQAIARLVDDPALATRLGGQARRRCEERYSFAAARRDLLPLLERVAAGRTRQR
jgi:glycosyltransferase involved in cell wall biosynthesis